MLAIWECKYESQEGQKMERAILCVLWHDILNNDRNSLALVLLDELLDRKAGSTVDIVDLSPFLGVYSTTVITIVKYIGIYS